LKDLKMWEPPFEDEEISLEEKQEILKNTSVEVNSCGGASTCWKMNVDLSPESNIVHYDEMFGYLKGAYNSRRERITDDILKDILSPEEFKEWQTPGIHEFKREWDDKIPVRDFKNMPEDYKYNLFEDMPYLFFVYCKLSDEEMQKLKEEINNNRNVQSNLIDFAKWKVNEDLNNINQKKFNYGLYALEITLVDNNKSEIKEILKQYIKASKENNLSFGTFMERNKPLNDLIKELVWDEAAKEPVAGT